MKIIMPFSAAFAVSAFPIMRSTMKRSAAILLLSLAAYTVHSPSATPRFPIPIRRSSARRSTSPTGFEVNLFAADPLLAKPIQMNFDAAGPAVGRLAARSIRRSSRARRRTTRSSSSKTPTATARPTRRTVFADGLLIPTGVEPGDGGAYVANSTELLHFNDTDGDGKADETPRRALRLRHRGHAPHPPHASAGARTAALLQPVDLHPQPHRDAATACGG